MTARRDPAKALKVLAAATTMRTRVGGEFQPIYRQRVDRIRADAEAAVGRDASRLWAEGTRLGLDDAVRFHDMVPIERVPDFIGAATALVLPSRAEINEQFGRVIATFQAV